MTPLYDYYTKKRERKFWEISIFSNIVKIMIAIIFILPMAGCESTSSVNGIPQPYNLTAMGNSTGIVGFTQLVNTDLMNGFFGTGILVTTFIIVFGSVIVSTAHAGKAFAASSFIIFAISILLLAIKLVPGYIVYSCLALAAISVAFLKPID